MVAPGCSTICSLLNVPGRTVKIHVVIIGHSLQDSQTRGGFIRGDTKQIPGSLVCVNFYIRSYMQHMRPTIHQKTCGPSQLRYYTFTVNIRLQKHVFLTGSQPVHSVRCLSHQQTSRRDVWFESRCQQHGNGALHDGPVGLCHGLDRFHL